MNRNIIFTAIMTLLVSAFAVGCGPVDGEDWGYESQQAALTSVDHSQAPSTGDIRQWEEIAKWTSARLEEEEQTGEIDDTWDQHEVRRVEALPEVQTHREAAEDVVALDLELLDGEGTEDDYDEE